MPPVSLRKQNVVITRTCKGGSARVCTREQTHVVNAVRKIPRTPLGPAQEITVGLRVCSVHAARMLVGQTVTGVGKIVSKERL